MKLTHLIIRNLLYFRKQNLAVLAAVIISTAVLTGALIIGDSVRYTLRHMVDSRLGKVRFALQTTDRFINSQLAKTFSDETKYSASAVLAVQGISLNPQNNLQINKTFVYGIDGSFWQFSEEILPELNDNEIFVSENTAKRLELEMGSEIVLKFEKIGKIPLNAPFASSQSPIVSGRFVVKQILNSRQLGRFSLKSNQMEPYNVFVSRDIIGKMLELSGLSNLILLEGNQLQSAENLNELLQKHWQIEDIGLKCKQTGQAGIYQLVSDRIFIDKPVCQLLEPDSKQTVLTYLVNSIRKDSNETPYSFVSAIGNSERFNFVDPHDIVINQWLADDLNAKTGDSIELSWFKIGTLRQLLEVKAKFKVKEIIPLERSAELILLMPDFPGISNAGSCSEWETGVPIDLDKIRDKDEKYWNMYKGTPKAYISIEYGKKLWQNQFGDLTSLRFDSVQFSPSMLSDKIHEKLKPQDFGMFFLPVYQQGIDATQHAVDFGELFLSLSFFVIAAGVLLTVLIHVFNSYSRSSETMLLLGLGFSRNRILGLKLLEAFLLLIPAGILGALLGILYNYLIMAGINSIWNDVVRTNHLEVYIRFSTLFIGAISGIIISLISIWLTSRRIVRQEIALALKKEYAGKSTEKSFKINRFFSLFALVLALVMTILTFSSTEANSSVLLISGALILFGLTGIISLTFSKIQQSNLQSRFNKRFLILKNVSRNKGRSVTAILLMAFGVYVVIITGANRKSYFGNDNLNSSGTGGYQFWAETSIPIPYRLNSPEGKEKIGLNPEDLPNEIKFNQFFYLDGDDASCLNLNQVQRPGILGINAKEFAQRLSFSFSKILRGTDKDSAWLALYKNYGPNVVPAIADQTVLTWGLKKSVGDTLVYLNEKGERLYVLIVGGLDNSIFQGNLLIADSLFFRHFPSVGGSKYMLIDAPAESNSLISDKLNHVLFDYGLELSPAKERLAEFNSVTNTYLSVFMALGGLGILIGTTGLGIVLLRNIQERKAELAMMLSIGLKRRDLLSIIVIENGILVVFGVIVGLISSLPIIFQSIFSISSNLPYVFISVMVVLIMINGFIWIYFPVNKALNSSIIAVLKDE